MEMLLDDGTVGLIRITPEDERAVWTITPDYRFRVGERLRDEFKNGRSYYDLDGATVYTPAQAELRPKQQLLEWHQTDVFKG